MGRNVEDRVFAWLSPSQLPAALMLTAVVFGAVLISRVTGLLTDASLTGFHQTALVLMWLLLHWGCGFIHVPECDAYKASL